LTNRTFSYSLYRYV